MRLAKAHMENPQLWLQVIVKWGGVLTHLGRRQSEELGNIYRMVMYPNSSDGGLLRLHSTYRHDLKIYSSDEGRVQTSAAAFAKGLLDLEGDSLVRVAAWCRLCDHPPIDSSIDCAGFACMLPFILAV